MTLFNCIGYVAASDRLIVNDELQRMWQKAGVAYF
jgi:hypothetical protein